MNTSPLLSDDARAGTCHARAHRPPPSTRSSRVSHDRASSSAKGAPSTPPSRYATPE
tara:strand:- start:257 stop:427 length:171 start_codon:yes stop_codon:yes gene_type:complete